MAYRRDALAGVSRLHLAIREIAVKHGGVCTVGSVKTQAWYRDRSGRRSGDDTGSTSLKRRIIGNDVSRSESRE